MCKCRVYHHLKPTFGMLSLPSVEDMTEFNVVLFISLPQSNEQEMLNYLFSATNSHDEPWTKKFMLNGNHRSTSVGDLIAIDDRMYQVAPVGFIPITQTKKEL